MPEPKLKLVESPEPRLLGPFERAVSTVRAVDVAFIPYIRGGPETLFSRGVLWKDAPFGDEALAHHFLAHPRLFQLVLARMHWNADVRGILFPATRKVKPLTERGEDPFPFLYAALLKQGEHGWKYKEIDNENNLLYVCVFTERWARK